MGLVFQMVNTSVYDADNQPEPHALRMLVEHAETTEDAVGAVGHVRTVNESETG